MNEEFLSEATLNIISTLLVLGAAAVCVLYWIAYKMEQTDQLLSFTPMDTDPVPDHFHPRAEHINRVLSDLASLRTPLKDYKLPRAGAVYEMPQVPPAADPYVPHVTGVRLP